nr:reverse transcriptase domain-containing protein [Tanacetum cinerariifolium]
MSSPTHPTPSDVDEEYAFPSVNILDYTSTLPNYFLATSGNISFNFLENPKNDEIPPVFSPFYNNPYIEVMQAYDATNELPIPPLQIPIASPTIMPPVLSLFDSQDFLPPKEISPPKDVETPVESSILVSPSSSVRSSSLVSNCAEENKVTFATSTLTDDALSWWNAYTQPIRIEQANKYCPQTEVKKMEDEFYNLVVKGNDLKTYIRRFQELAVLCPNIVPNSEKLMEVFIKGLPRSIKGNVITSKPQTLDPEIDGASNKTQFYTRNQ